LLKVSDVRTSQKKSCLFCHEPAAIELHHHIPQRITRRIPELVRDEVLHDILGVDPKLTHPICRNCHSKLHKILKPFEKCILLFSDIKSMEKKVVNRRMKNKILDMIKENGKGNYADLKRILAELKEKDLRNNEAIELLKQMRIEGSIYFVLPDESSARDDPSFVNKITY